MRRVAVCAALLVLLAGCGQAPKTVRERLPAMVLPKSAYGAQAAALRRTQPSGYLSNEQRARSDFDPLVTARLLARAGCQTGYALQFGLSRGQLSRAMQRGHGLLEVGSLAELYRDPPAVSRQFRRTVRDLRALVGKPLNLGGTLEGVTVVPVPGIGDEAVRLTLVVRVSGVRVQLTEVGFRAGRLAGVVVETWAGSTNVDPEVTSLARVLASRIGSSDQQPAKAATSAPASHFRARV